MADTEILEDIRSDLNFLKEKLSRIEITIDGIDDDLHKELNPDYEKKLEKIEREDKRVHLKNMDEFDRRFGL